MSAYEFKTIMKIPFLFAGILLSNYRLNPLVWVSSATGSLSGHGYLTVV